jgi:hypothetical protein
MSFPHHPSRPSPPVAKQPKKTFLIKIKGSVYQCDGHNPTANMQSNTSNAATSLAMEERQAWLWMNVVPSPLESGSNKALDQPVLCKLQSCDLARFNVLHTKNAPKMLLSS